MGEALSAEEEVERLSAGECGEVVVRGRQGRRPSLETVRYVMRLHSLC